MQPMSIATAGTTLADFARMSIKTCFSAAMPLMVLAIAGMPVTLSNLTTGPQSHVRLTNTASQPVTATA
jgi:hypothetical protein